MEFSRQEYWRGLPFPPPGDLPDQGMNPRLLCLLHWLVHFFFFFFLPLSPLESPSWEPDTNPEASGQRRRDEAEVQSHDDQSQKAVPDPLAHLRRSRPDTLLSSEPEAVCKVDEQGCLLAS